MTAAPFVLAALLFAPPPGTLGDPAREDVFPDEIAVDLLNERGSDALVPEELDDAILRDELVNSGPYAPTVHLTGTDVAASVRVGGRPLTVWHGAPAPRSAYRLPLPKPFAFPLYTPGGVNVLDYASDDHPHHKGLWVAVDEVELHTPDGKTLGPFKHWIEKGRIETQDVTLDAEAGTIRYTSHWLSPEGTPVLQEETTITFVGVPSTGTLIQYDVTLSPPPGGGTATIGDTKEGFLAVRMAPELTVKKGAGVITNSEGGVGEEECWGKPASWCDYSAPASAADGNAGVSGGVALFDHPKNPRPARYHVRGYGLMGISPFGPRAYSKRKEPADPITFTAEKPLRLRYAAFVHVGDAKAADVADVYLTYASAVR